MPHSVHFQIVFGSFIVVSPSLLQVSDTGYRTAVPPRLFCLHPDLFNTLSRSRENASRQYGKNKKQHRKTISASSLSSRRIRGKNCGFLTGNVRTRYKKGAKPSRSAPNEKNCADFEVKLPRSSRRRHPSRKPVPPRSSYPEAAVPRRWRRHRCRLSSHTR